MATKTRILRAVDDLRRASTSLLGLGDYLPIKLTIEAYKPTRSVEQNQKFHAICSDISKQRDWAGNKLDTEDWKRLLVDTYLRGEGEPSKVVPSLDGTGVVSLGRQTRKMDTTTMSGLIEFSTAWAIDEGIELGD